MKKLLFTLSAVLFCFLADAQNAFLEKWPNGNTKTEGFVFGDPTIEINATKEVQSRQQNSMVKEGKWNTYYENASLRSEEHYDHGKMVGKWKVLYENGVLESEINFTSGTATFYHKNGQKHSEGGMITGMVHTGNWICYHDNGNKNYEGAYDNSGNKIGTWKWFNEKGIQTSEQVYDKGNLISTKDISR